MDLEDLWTPVSPRTLREVVDRLCEEGHVVADAPVDDRRVITGVCQDSRRVRPGDLYAALPGRRHHGADFASIVEWSTGTCGRPHGFRRWKCG